MDIMVYFSNGKKERFSEESVVLVHDGVLPAEVALPPAPIEKALINWNNVCFFRRIEEREETDDD